MCFFDRDVAQSGRAPRSGRGGRKFKSSHPDHLTITYKVSDYISPLVAYLLLLIISAFSFKAHHK